MEWLSEDLITIGRVLIGKIPQVRRLTEVKVIGQGFFEKWNFEPFGCDVKH